MQLAQVKTVRQRKVHLSHPFVGSGLSQMQLQKSLEQYQKKQYQKKQYQKKSSHNLPTDRARELFKPSKEEESLLRSKKSGNFWVGTFFSVT